MAEGRTEGWSLSASEAHHQSLQLLHCSPLELRWFSLDLQYQAVTYHDWTRLKQQALSMIKWVVWNRKPDENQRSQLVQVIMLFTFSVHYRWYSNVVFKTSVCTQFDALTLLKQLHESILVKILRLWMWMCKCLDNLDSVHIAAAVKRSCQS